MISFVFSNKKKIPEDLTRKEWESLIDETIIGRNGLRDREIIKENLLDGITYEKIAEKHELSTRQVARIISIRKGQIYKRKMS